MRVLLSLFAAALMVTGCGGGVDAESSPPVRIFMSAGRQWSVPTAGTKFILPGAIKAVDLGYALREFGYLLEGDTLTLLCEGREVDSAELGIPVQAEIIVWLEAK